MSTAAHSTTSTANSLRAGPVVTVLGGTGFVGGHLVHRLLQTNAVVRCSYRDPRNAQLIRRLGADPTYVDLLDPGSLATAIARSDVVVNLVTTIHRDRLRRTLYDGAANLRQALLSQGVHRVIQMDALVPQDIALTSDASYIYWKRRGALLLAEPPLVATTLHASIIFGRGDQHPSAIAAAMRYLRRAPVPRGPALMTLFQPVFVGDVVDQICDLILLSPAPRSSGINIVGPDVLSYAEIVEIVCDALGMPVATIHVPLVAARAALYCLSCCLSYSPLTEGLLDMIGIDSTASACFEAAGSETVTRVTSFRSTSDYLRDFGVDDIRAWLNGTPRSLHYFAHSSLAIRRG
ncbi:MAG: NAD(P)H-binding protein [Acidobacteria bacterium]|nr:NAD(P)H-binding protein [Acidobacteriota bacterium]